ncbi:phosphodiester glycosidase family protein [Phormidesmis priestleyi]
MRGLYRLVLLALVFLISICTVVIIPTYFLKSTLAMGQTRKQCPTEYKANFTDGKFQAEAAEVNCLQGKSGSVGIEYPDRNGTFKLAEPNKRIGKGRLVVPKNSGATVGLVSKLNKKRILNLIAVGFSKKTDSSYIFTCNISGSVAIGSIPKISICTNIPYNRTARSTDSRTKALPKSEGAPVNARQFCSALASSGYPWDYDYVSNTKAGLDIRDKDICQLALEKCEKNPEKKAEDTCQITNQGSWRDYDPNANKLNVLLQCSDRSQPYYAQGEGKDIDTLVSKLKQQSYTDKAKNCALYLYNNDEVLISPQGNDRTLIHTEETNAGFVINGLVGEAKIIGSKDPRTDQPIVTPLKARESYRFKDSTDTGKAQPLSREEFRKVATLPVVKAFVDCKNWELEETCAEVQKYGETLLPATDVEQVTIKGFEVWKATINLAKPGISVALADSRRVTAANFNQFVQQQQASLILGGIYRLGNWNLRSQGTTRSSGTQAAYTILALDSNNRPKMVTLTDPGSSIDLNQYPFVLQAGPRLVRDGKAALTAESVKREKHTLSVTNRDFRRAGICISQDQAKLYYVLRNSPGMSITDLAKVMASEQIGCWQAMNLDGGMGPALAYEGQAKAPPDNSGTSKAEAQPFMIVVREK